MSMKAEFQLDESDLSTEEAGVYKRMQIERDNADSDVDDCALLDALVYRERAYGIDWAENIIRDLINERAGHRSKNELVENYDRAMKGLK